MQNDRPDSILKTIFSKDVVLLSVLGIALLIFSVCCRDNAFPAASLDLKVNKKMAIRLAEVYAETTGFVVPKRVTSSTYFSSDHDAATFLEYEYPTAEANELLRKEIPIWRWTVHLLDGSDDEIKVCIGPDGALQSFERDLNKEKSIPSISREQAQQQVIGYAAKQLQLSLSDWKLISYEESKLPRRIDHSFIWENEQKDYRGGHLRLSAIVSGDKLSYFSYHLHVPESFEQKFKWLRAQNKGLSNISYIFCFLFALCLPVMFLRAWTRGQLRVKFAIICGIIGAVIAFISNLNDAATIVSGTSNWSMETYLAKYFINGLTTALITGVVCTIFFGTIETVFRKAFPSQAACELFFSKPSMVFRSLSVAKAAVLGSAVFGITIGYQVVFFLIGRQFGLWTPLAVNERSIIDDFFPAWNAISLGAEASTVEEFGFRIFVLALIQRGTRSFWLANILQAAIWAFGHCTYAVEPPYARGIELTIGGIFHGWILRRYGVLPVLLGHYAFDAYLSIQPLFGSHEIIDWISAFLAMTPLLVLPALSFLYISKLGFIAEEEISNESITSSVIAQQSNEGVKQQLWPAYKPITKHQILAASIVAFASSLMFTLPRKKLGDEPMVAVNHEQAIVIAKDFFAREDFKVDGLIATAWMSDDTDAEQIQYISKYANFEQTSRLERLIEPRLVWNVRLFRPGDPTVFYVRIGPNGKPVTSTISINELAPGAKLNKVEATALANNYLNSIETEDSGKYVIFDTSQLDRPNRTDYSFTAENASANIGKARFQISFKLIGDKISGVRKTWAMPDTSEKKRKYTTKTDVLVLVAQLICAIIVIPNIAYWIFGTLKRQAPNKYLISAAVLIAATLSLVEQANYISRIMLSTYNPTEPLDTHLLQVGLGCLTRLAMDVSVAALLAVVVSSSYPGLFVSNRLSELLKSAKPQISNYRIWSDGIIIGVSAALVAGGLMNLNEFLISYSSKSFLIAKLHSLPWLEQTNLTLTIVLDAIRYGLVFVLAGAAILGWSNFYVIQRANNPSKSTYKGYSLVVPILIAAIICAVNLSPSDPVKSVCNIGANLSLAAALYLVLKVIGNGNLVGCFFTAFFMTVGKDLYYVQKNLALIHPVDLMALYGLFIAPFFWFLISLWLDLRKPTSEPQDPS